MQGGWWRLATVTVLTHLRPAPRLSAKRGESTGRFMKRLNDGVRDGPNASLDVLFLHLLTSLNSIKLIIEEAPRRGFKKNVVRVPRVSPAPYRVSSRRAVLAETRQDFLDRRALLSSQAHSLQRSPLASYVSRHTHFNLITEEPQAQPLAADHENRRLRSVSLASSAPIA